MKLYIISLVAFLHLSPTSGYLWDSPITTYSCWSTKHNISVTGCTYYGSGSSYGCCVDYDDFFELELRCAIGGTYCSSGVFVIPSFTEEGDTPPPDRPTKVKVTTSRPGETTDDYLNWGNWKTPPSFNKPSTLRVPFISAAQPEIERRPSWAWFSISVIPAIVAVALIAKYGCCCKQRPQQDRPQPVAAARSPPVRGNVAIVYRIDRGDGKAPTCYTNIQDL